MEKLLEKKNLVTFIDIISKLFIRLDPLVSTCPSVPYQSQKFLQRVFQECLDECLQNLLHV